MGTLLKLFQECPKTAMNDKRTFMLCTRGDHHQASSSGYGGIRGNASHEAKTWKLQCKKC